jgi:hypothetical protein
MDGSVGQEERNLNKKSIIKKFRNNVIDFIQKNIN